MKYYCVKQHDETDCGAACLATISKQYGLKLSISKIREIAGTDKQGTNVVGMIKAAEDAGFSAKGIKGNQDAFFGDFPKPCIAHVVVDGMTLHYVVVHKVTKDKIIIADPAKGLVNYAPEDFFKIWTGILIILVPTSRFEKGDRTQGTLSRFFKLLWPQKRLLDPDMPEVNDVNMIKTMITFTGMKVRKEKRFGKNAFGFFFDCTWDPEEGIGIRMSEFNVDKIGIEGIAF